MADDRSAAAEDRETSGAAAESTQIVGSAGGVGGVGGVGGAGGAGQPPAGSDATAAIPAADATARIRGMTDPGQQPTQRVTPRIWAARVPIAPDDIAPIRESAPPEWEQAEWEQAEWEQPQEEPDATGDRPPLHPAVLALIVVALLAMLGTGLWLIFHRSAEAPVPVPGLPPVASAAPTPVDTATATDTAPPTDEATTEAPTPTGAPTTAPAPTQAPAPPPPPTTQAMVAVPNGLVGLPLKAAEQKLMAVGLTYQVAGLPTGRVTATRPEAGTMVPRGSQVTLVVLGPSSPSATIKVPASE